MIPSDRSNFGKQDSPELFEQEAPIIETPDPAQLVSDSKTNQNPSMSRSEKPDKSNRSIVYAVLATLFVLFFVAFFQFGLFTRSTSALGDLFLNPEKPLIGLEFFSIGLIFAPDDTELCSKRANVERFLGKNSDAVDDLSHLITLTGSRCSGATCRLLYKSSKTK